MRNNQNLPNRRIDSNNINGRQLPSTSPVYHNSRSRTPYRSQSRNISNNNSYNRDNRNYQRHHNSNNNYNNRSGSYNRNNYNRSRTNSYNRNNNHNKYNNSRSSSRYTNHSNSRQHSSYNRNNHNYNNNNRQRHYSRDSNKSDRYRQRSGSNNKHFCNNNNRDDRRHSTQREQNDRYHSKDRRIDGNKYNNNNKNRIINIETERQNDDPPGIDDYEYTSESSNEDQEILDIFYNANEDTCNKVINTLESNPTWILPMHQLNKIEQELKKQRPLLEIDLLLDSGATLNLLNEDTWNEIKYNNPDVRLEQANKTLTAANNTTIETFGTITLNLTPDRISNKSNAKSNT